MAEGAVAATRAWLTKAWRDLEIARRAVRGEPALYDIAAYHCQQAADKALKALLVYHGRSFEKTHDLEVLLDLAREIDPSVGCLADAADALTPYATRFRYPHASFALDPTPAEYEEAQQQAEAVFQFVLSRLPPEVRP